VIPEKNLDELLEEIQDENSEFQRKFGVYIGRLFSLGMSNDR
jgi:hypothetical protein